MNAEATPNGGRVPAPGKRRTYELPAKLSRPALLGRLEEAGYPVESSGASTETDVYFDTQAGHLYRKGLRLRRRALARGHVWQLVGAGSGPLESLTSGEGFPTEGPVHDEVTRRTKGNVLFAFLQIRFRQERYSMTGPGGSRFDLLLYTGLRFTNTLSGEHKTHPPLATVRRMKGDPNESEYLGVFLRDGAGLRRVSGGLFPTGLKHLSIAPPGAPLPASLLVRGEDPMTVAGRKVLAQQLYRMRANTAGTIEDLDIEFLHDLRVASRRARAALQLFRDILGRRRCEPIRRELKWVADVLGGVRDLDVFIPNLDTRYEAALVNPEGRAWITGAFREQRKKALAELVEALQSRRFALLLQRMERLAESPPPRMPRGNGALPSHSAGAALVEGAVKRVLKLARKMGDAPDEEGLHRLRILFKRLRYTAEFFKSTLDRDPKKELALLVDVQDCLGEHQDAVVAMERLSALALNPPGGESLPPGLLLEIGALIQAERAVAQQRRDAFDGLWSKFRKAYF